MQFTLKQLRYFVACAEAGSVTAAARRLNISQPSVSAAIAELEKSLGLDLFLRHHAQGLSLTPAGRRLLVEALGLLAHAEELRQGALDLSQRPAGEIELGCFETFGPMRMPGLLRALKTRFPEIAVRVHEAHLAGLLEGLRRGRFDLALTYDLGLGPEFAFETLAEVPLYVMLPIDHRLAARKAVALADLADEPLVLLDLPQSRDHFLSVMRSRGLEPRIAHETASFEMVRGLVANGFGYSLMHSRPHSDRALDGRRLAYRPTREAVPPQKLGLARLGRARPTRAALRFVEFCREHFAGRD
jgi:DNA-binding transcriptional LysR family regulator